MNNNEIVLTIKKELDQRNMTYKDLSAISGVPLDTINNFFRGKTKNPRIDTLHALEEALGLSQPLEWTDEEKAFGVGNHTTYLSEDEFDWLELRSEILQIYGKEYMENLIITLKALVKKFPSKP